MANSLTGIHADCRGAAPTARRPVSTVHVLREQSQTALECVVKVCSEGTETSAALNSSAAMAPLASSTQPTASASPSHLSLSTLMETESASPARLKALSLI